MYLICMHFRPWHLHCTTGALWRPGTRLPCSSHAPRGTRVAGGRRWKQGPPAGTFCRGQRGNATATYREIAVPTKLDGVGTKQPAPAAGLTLVQFSERPDGGSHHGGSRDRAPLSLGPRSPFRPCVAAICWIRSAKSSIALGDEE